MDRLICGDVGYGKTEIAIYKSNGKLVNEYSCDLSALPVKITEKFEDDSEIYMVRLFYDGTIKEYFFSSNEEHPYESSKNFPKAELQVFFGKEERNGELIKLSAKVKNISSHPAYFVYPKDETLGYAILADDAYFTLLPGEERSVNMIMRPCIGLFFEKTSEKARLSFRTLNG